MGPSVRPSSKIQNLKVGVYIWGGECDFLDLKMMGGNSEKSENALIRSVRERFSEALVYLKIMVPIVKATGNY